MSELSTEEVLKIAELACLELSEEEQRDLTAELNSILEYVRRLDQIDVKGIEPLAHVHGSRNVFRADQVKSFEQTEKLIELTPDREASFIRVPIVVEQTE